MEKSTENYLRSKVWNAIDRYTDRFDIEQVTFTRWSTTEGNVNVTFNRCKDWGGCDVIATVKLNGEKVGFAYLDCQMNWEGVLFSEKK